MRIIIGVLSVVVLAGCTASDEAVRALSGAGYAKIEVTGYRFFGCDEKDTFSTGFKAVGPTGQPVSGVVCSGLLKGATIRVD